jgi:hypothetical protein
MWEMIRHPEANLLFENAGTLMVENAKIVFGESKSAS